MRGLLSKIEQVNGVGWFIGIVANIIWTTLVVAALYWKLHEEVAIIKVNQHQQAEAVRLVREELSNKVATKAELQAMWNLGQEQHERMKDEMRRRVAN
jgi:hypothetical protein